MNTPGAINRRGFLRNAIGAAGGVCLAQAVNKAHAAPQTLSKEATPAVPVSSYGSFRSVATPNGKSLTWREVEGTKIFHLVAEPVTHEFAPGLVAECWGYNGQVHGPTIEVVDGDHIRIYMTNKLSAPTALHCHGVFVPNGMDGVGGLTQKLIQPGETFKYEFTVRQHGTFMYHSHYDEMTQMAMGMMGMFIAHPRGKAPDADYDFAIMLSEWRIAAGARRPDPNEMSDFNVLTLNARVYPGTAPLIVKTNSRVRIRFGNLSAMDHHVMHLHGNRFFVTGTDGGEIPASARWPETTVLVGVGQTRTVEFIASAPGDWALHCHMTHHAMNQMGHRSGNMIGVEPDDLNERVRKLVPGYMAMGQAGMGDMGKMGMAVPKNSLPMAGSPGPFDYIPMGGMFTLLKVRDELPADNSDPGWYHHPAGTVADVASNADLKRDGIEE